MRVVLALLERAKLGRGEDALGESRYVAAPGQDLDPEVVARFVPVEPRLFVARLGDEDLAEALLGLLVKAFLEELDTGPEVFVGVGRDCLVARAQPGDQPGGGRKHEDGRECQAALGATRAHACCSSPEQPSQVTRARSGSTPLGRRAPGF